MYPEDLRYTAEHEWIRVEGDVGTVGITWFAQDQLGDVVFVELPEPGRLVGQLEAFGVVESVKSVSDLYSPVSGEVIARNEALFDRPELVNRDPYGEGWMIKLRLAKRAELETLLTAAQYKQQIGEAQEGRR